jgi:hypothetical protein
MTTLSLHLVDVPTTRPCDGCTACCTVLRVKELGKPAHVPCAHLGGLGCAQYESRPVSCRNWSCLWAQGLISGDEHRPDRIGLVLDVIVSSMGSYVAAYEVWQGASAQPRAGQLLDGVAQTLKVTVISPDRANSCLAAKQASGSIFD